MDSGMTSMMFKLSCKMSQHGFLDQLNRLCGISKHQYNFVHLPWKQLAIVNFTNSEICDRCFQVMKQVAGTPGVCVASVKEGMHKGLEANLAYFCAKCCQKSDYQDLPIILVNGEEVPLGLACKLFVPDDLLIQYLERLPNHRRPEQRKNWSSYDQYEKTTEQKKGNKISYQPPTNSASKMLHGVNGYQGASKPGQPPVNEIKFNIPLEMDHYYGVNEIPTMVLSLWCSLRTCLLEQRQSQKSKKSPCVCCTQEATQVCGLVTLCELCYAHRNHEGDSRWSEACCDL